ncbi:PAS/PAC sensor signal transduction histidine kinase [Rhizobium sp. CF080]|uniref:sensor histidine kinase n=1 Tax=Rhizobium sp. (strain CF080) TaxID=1144310 RepID=UPI0003E809FF|nr:PAS domain-containing sensor histidine kinase [Rhizobium sp. CF080]EUC00240.1 PAS/PAC sensor signal transduction histidine kinase [Rhizobium sp. CF080]
MSAVQYPFIDIAVHERVRDRFAAGEAIVLFSPDMKNPLWANGRGADLFGFSSIYDFLDQGPNHVDIAFRQIEAAARQLDQVGDIRNLTIRVASGFQRIPVQAVCELVQVQGETAVLFSAPGEKGRLSGSASAARMIEGFDDPDTHMAVIDENGEILAASAEFAGLGVSTQTAKMMTTMAGADPSRLVKRPIPTAKGYLPAAIGKLSSEPALHLLFTVETEQGRAAAANGYEPRDEAPATPEDDQASAGIVMEAAPPATGDSAEDLTVEAISADGFADVIAAVSEIEDTEEPEEEILLETGENLAPVQAAASGAMVEEAASEKAEPIAEAEAVSSVEAIETAEELVSETATAEPLVAEPPLMEAAPAIDPPDAEIAAREPAGFVFRRDGRATRFVWKIDSEGRFREVSTEFADAVGPHAADINGMAFTDLAALFHLDPEGKITELLNKRDTWSGKTIWWPIEGTSLVVPVDLAALPTYTRTREFDGFRGFGIVRISDAAEDPNAVGLTLTRAVPEDVVEQEAESVSEAYEMPVDALELAADDNLSVWQEETSDVPAEIVEIEEHTPDVGAGEDTIIEGPASDESVAEAIAADEAVISEEPEIAEDAEQPAAAEDISADAAPSEDLLAEPVTQDEPKSSMSGRQIPSLLDWPAGERPALRIVENAGRRHSDKVIQLEERRSNRRDGLTPIEQAAFREIARQLDNFVGRRNEEKTPGIPTEAEAPAVEQSEPTAVEPAAVEHETVSAEPFDPVSEDAIEAPAEAMPEIETAPEAEVAPEAEDISEEEAIAFAQDANEAFADAPIEPVADKEAVAEEPADPHPELSDRELLSQMIPVRERIGLSAEIVDQMPVALLVHAGDLLIHGNPEFLRLTGYASVSELAEVGGLDALLQRQDLEGKTTEAGGMVVVRADDALVPVTARLQSVRWDNSTVLMLALMPVVAETQTSSEGGEAADVIPLRAPRPADQLAKLQVEVTELRAILETATDGVVIIGAEGDIRSLNRAASALFNYDNEEINGKPFVTLFAHESQRAILDYLAGLAGHGVASVLNDGREVIGREASGGFLPLFMTIGKLTSSNGYCAVIRDITQWKRTEDELRTAKRAAETANAHKSEFLAHVSHEIRTPLNAIIGFADMMATERFGQIGHARYVEYANDISRSGRHVLDIVNDLLDISKIEAGEMELDFVAVGLNEAVSEAVSLVQPQANGQRVIIRTALSHAVPQVVADPRSIKQIVLNILSNAIRFTPSGGQIVVSTAYETNGNVVLRVRDTGIGMTRSELELAMKPFRQVSGASHKRGDGTGLGLPLTKAMVDANRAAFAITSAPNEGTLVEITFPSPRVLAN